MLIPALQASSLDSRSLRREESLKTRSLKRKCCMQHENIPIGDICAELRKLARSGILRENTAESCKQAAVLLEKIRRAVLLGVPLRYKGNTKLMSHAEAIALATNLHQIFVVEHGEG
jgi:hypothetical protein